MLDRLPAELLQPIISNLRDENDIESLAACARVCRCLRNPVTDLLYRNVVLTNSSLQPFLQGYQKSRARNIKSLTLSLDLLGLELRPGSSETDIRLDAAKHLSGQLQILSKHLPCFESLVTFSLWVIDLAGRAFNYPIWRSDIARMLDALPPTLVSLEIDTKGHDNVGDSSYHACLSLSKVLPRLKHLRLRMGMMCDKMLKNVDELRGLESVCINCNIKRGQARVCGPTGGGQCDMLFNNLDRPHLPKARISLIKRWPEVLQKSKASRQMNSKFCIVERVRKYTAETAEFQTLRRRVLDANATVVMPIIEFYNGSIMWIRTLSSSDLIGSEVDVDTVAEDSVWRTTAYFARVVSNKAIDGPTLPITPPSGVDPCAFWNNETKVGHNILNACVRPGLHDTEPLRWVVPIGWRDRNGVLERIVP